MKIAEVINYLDAFAPLALQENYDNAGLVIGNKDAELTGILCCLDSTEEIITEAKEKNCNLVIAHHPIIFSGLKKITGATYIERTILSAIRNNIALYAIHTNLDNIASGVNNKIAEKLQLKHCKVLKPIKNSLRKLITFVPNEKAEYVRNHLFAAGAGAIGKYDQCSFTVDGKGTFRAGEGTHPYVGEQNKLHTEPEQKIEMVFPFYLQNAIVETLFRAHPYEEVAYDIYVLENTFQGAGSGLVGELQEPMDAEKFLQFLKTSMKVEVVRFTKPPLHQLKTIAVCGGSGSFLLTDAIKSGADVLLTADFKYHQFFDADGKIMIADIGHYETEQFTPELISEILREKFANFGGSIPVLTGKNTNPIKYF